MGPYDDFDRFPGGRRVNDIDRKMRDLQMEREQLIAEATIKPLEPKDAMLVRLALEAGEMKSAYRAATEATEKAEKKLLNYEGQDYHAQLIEVTHNRDLWKARAQKAEETLKRSRAARRRK